MHNFRLRKQQPGMYESVHTTEEVGELLSAVDLILPLVAVPSSSLVLSLLLLVSFYFIGPNEPVQNVSGPHWSGLSCRDRKG